MTIDPKFTFLLGIWTNVLALVASYGVEHAPPLIAQYAPMVQWVAGFLFQANSVVLTALVGYSSSKAGPLVSVPPSAIKPIVIFAIGIAALFALSGDAHAQGVRLAPKAAAPVASVAADKCALIWDPLKLCGALTGNPADDLKRVADRIRQLNKSDLAYAIAKASAAGSPASKIRLSCLNAISDAAAAYSGENLKDSSGNPLVRPDPAFITNIEDVAELIDNLSPQGVLFTSCAGAAQMFKTNTLTFINAVVTGAASIAALPAGL